MPDGFTAGDISIGKNMWYIVMENTNSRLHDKNNVPTIFTSKEIGDHIAEQATDVMENVYTTVSVYTYNETFRRFMVLDRY